MTTPAPATAVAAELIGESKKTLKNLAMLGITIGLAYWLYSRLS